MAVKSENKEMFKANSIVKEFINEIRLECPNNIKRALLFGSRAKGNYKSYSDYDIFLVLSKKDSSTLNKIYDKVLDYSIKYGIDLSLKIYSREEIKTERALSAPFILEVEKTGIDLWKKLH